MFDGSANRVIGGAQISFDLGKALAGHADADARRRARRGAAVLARQMKPDDVFAGKHVALTQTAVGIAPRGLELQAEHIGVEGLIGLKPARGQGDVVDGFDAKANFRNHSRATPRIGCCRSRELTKLERASSMIFVTEEKKNFSVTRQARES